MAKFSLDIRALPKQPYTWPIKSKNCDAIETQATAQGFDRPMVTVDSRGRWFLTAFEKDGEYIEFNMPTPGQAGAVAHCQTCRCVDSS